MNDWIDLVHTPLSVHIAQVFLQDPRAGAIDLFVGTTRADDPRLIALDYQAYDEMAVARMNFLAGTARSNFDIAKLVMLHRVGRVPLMQASVLIGVSTPHRASAFEACRFLIDAVKRDVPVWKRDVMQSEGVITTSDWSHPT